MRPSSNISTPLLCRACRVALFALCCSAIGCSRASREQGSGGSGVHAVGGGGLGTAGAIATSGIGGVTAAGAGTGGNGAPSRAGAGDTVSTSADAGGSGLGAGGMAGASGMSAGGSGGQAGAGGAAGSDPSAILVPAQGILLGLYYGDGSVAATTQRLGHAIRVHLVYYAFTDDWAAGSQADLAAGRIPLVNWEPDGIDFHDIASGKLDSTINARAAGAKALGQKVFLDFAAEMNGDEAWSGNDAALYVTAYRHIHDLFVAAGATNVIWAWCPNVTDTNGGNAMTMAYYPGDAYVDWSGVDGYNWGTTNGGWQSFQQVFARIYPLLAAIGKPILIGEMASAEAGGDKGAWIDAIVPTLKASFPMIRGLVWFDVDKETDWRVNSSAASQAAFIRMLNDPYCNP